MFHSIITEICELLVTDQRAAQSNGIARKNSRKYQQGYTPNRNAF